MVAQILEEATRAEHTTPFEVVENAKTDSEDESDGSEDGERKASQKLAYVDWDAALRSQELSNEATPTYEPAQAQRLVISGDAHTAQIIAQQGISFAESAIAAGQSGTNGILMAELKCVTQNGCSIYHIAHFLPQTLPELCWECWFFSRTICHLTFWRTSCSSWACAP